MTYATLVFASLLELALVVVGIWVGMPGLLVVIGTCFFVVLLLGLGFSWPEQETIVTPKHERQRAALQKRETAARIQMNERTNAFLRDVQRMTRS